MSEQLNHRMINFEATPPPIVWEGIAARLDDDKQYTVLATRLSGFEETPPQTLWDNLSARLNDDKEHSFLSTRINNFEAIPPDTAWSNIAATLTDDKQYSTVAARLNNFDAVPPKKIWDSIADTLHQTKKEETPVINIRKTIYRISAAAIIAGFFIGGWFVINRNNPVKIEVAKNNTNKPVPPSVKEENKTTAENNPVSKNNETTLPEQAFLTHAKKHNSFSASASRDDNGPVLKHALVNDLLAYQEKPIVISSSPILDNDGNVIRDLDVLTTSNYIMVTGPNGQATRISSKFANVIRYLNGNNNNEPEEYLDKVIKESNTWKKRFQEWRNKISQSSFIPSSANFLDIVEFKELIQEK